MKTEARESLVHGSEGSDSDSSEGETPEGWPSLLPKSPNRWRSEICKIEWEHFDRATIDGEECRDFALVLVRRLHEAKENVTKMFQNPKMVADIEMEKTWAEWSKMVFAITPAHFVQVISAIVPISHTDEVLRQFLNSLAFPIPDSWLNERPMWLPPDLESVFDAKVHHRMALGHRLIEVLEPENLKRASLEGPDFSKNRWCEWLAEKISWFVSRLGSGSFKLSNTRLAFCPAFRLFSFREPSGETRTSTVKAVMLRVLADCPPESEVFATPTGSAILSCVWNGSSEEQDQSWQNYLCLQASEQTWYFVDLLMCSVELFVLFVMAFYVRRKQSPATLYYRLLGILMFRTCFNVTTEMIMATRAFARRKCSFRGLSMYLTSIYGIVVLLEFFNIVSVATIMYRRSSGDPAAWLTTWEEGKKDCRQYEPYGTTFNPDCAVFSSLFFFSFLILFRWAYLIIHMLGFRAMGMNVLPAIHATTKPESLCFLGYMMIVVFGCFHSYYAYPIDDNVGDSSDILNREFFQLDKWISKDKTMSTFIKMFRLTMMGDFDLFELEGVDEPISGSIAGIRSDLNRSVTDFNINAKLQDAQPSDAYQRLLILFVLVSIIVNIVLLNVYIGLLSELYERAQKAKKQLYSQFVANQAYQYSLRLMFWDRMYRCCSRGSAAEEEEQNRGSAGVWIRWQRGTVGEEKEDTDEIIGEITGAKEQIINEMREQNNKLSNQNDKLSKQNEELTKTLQDIASRLQISRTPR